MGHVERRLKSSWHIIESAAACRGQQEKSRLVQAFLDCGVVQDNREYRIPNTRITLSAYELRTNEIDFRNAPSVTSFAKCIVRELRPAVAKPGTLEA